MNTPLLLFSALLPAALACGSHDSSLTQRDRPALIAAASTKTTTGEKAAAPTAPVKPAPKPAGKERETRRPRPEHLFM
jgi:hypothetical protein